MTAYSAIFLLKVRPFKLSGVVVHPFQLLRSSDAHPSLQSELPEGAAREIHAIIIRTAEAYNEAAHFSPTASLAAYHARFLWHLIHRHRTRPSVTRDRPHHDISLDLSIQSMVFLDFALSCR